MEAFSSSVSISMRAIVAACETPALVVLIIVVALVIVCLGSLIAEFFIERRHFRVFLPKLVDELKASEDDPRDVIKKSGLLLRQKQYLIELTRHRSITDEMRESLAVGLEYRERRRYDGIVKITDVLAKVSPMLGLLCTLIPLGPGVVALGVGDTETLSSALLTAFDATSMGLVAGVFSMVVSAIRTRWYKDYMVSFDACMECVLETEKSRQRCNPTEGESAGKVEAPAGEEEAPAAEEEALAETKEAPAGEEEVSGAQEEAPDEGDSL